MVCVADEKGQFKKRCGGWKEGHFLVVQHIFLSFEDQKSSKSMYTTQKEGGDLLEVPN
jgi:hypothetical protein